MIVIKCDKCGREESGWGRANFNARFCKLFISYFPDPNMQDVSDLESDWIFLCGDCRNQLNVEINKVVGAFFNKNEVFSWIECLDLFDMCAEK